MKYKETKEKVNMLQRPSSLKQMNFKMECFSSLLVTINTEVIIFNIRLSVITKLNHEIQEQWHLAPMLVYDSIHPRACSQNIGAFHLVYLRNDTKNGSSWP